MLRIFLLCLLLGMGTVGCKQQTPPPSNTSTFGSQIDPAGAVSVEEMLASLQGKTEADVKVVGEVKEVCQKKGCWLTLKNPQGEPVFVKFKGDDTVLFPLDMTGTIVVAGKAKVTTVPVDELRHYAEDKGATKEEIEKITEPQMQVRIEPVGVMKKS